MPAKHYIDNKAKLIITTWEGEAIDNDCIEELRRYQDDIQSKPDYFGYNEIVNFSKVTNFQLTTEGLRNIGHIALRTDQSNGNRKLGIVVNSNLAYTLAKMYIVFRNFAPSANKKIRVFKNENDALEWLNKEAPI